MVFVRITVNGHAENVAEGITVRELARLLGYEQKTVAIAINGDFVPRSRHDQQTLKEDDAVDIVAPMQGG